MGFIPNYITGIERDPFEIQCDDCGTWHDIDDMNNIKPNVWLCDGCCRKYKFETKYHTEEE